MALFKVTEIINGNTVEVGGWTWGELKGKKVKIRGYEVDSNSDIFAKNKLEVLLKNKEIELRSPVSLIADSKEGDPTIMCTVVLNEIDVSQYFPELTRRTT